MNTQTLNIALPVDLVKKVDEVAKKEYRNRSELIREALRLYIRTIEKWEELFSYGASVAKKMNITSEEQITKIVTNYRHGKKSA